MKKRRRKLFSENFASLVLVNQNIILKIKNIIGKQVLNYFILKSN